MDNTIMITPKTKVLQLLETYPQLEAVLIAYVPAFKKLTSPLLRKTVARITTLQQAASIGEVPVEDLINLLRKEVGQEQITVTASGSYHTEQPSWFEQDLVEREMDIIPMLKAGEQPVSQVLADLRSMEEGKIYKLIAPFLPAPLIEKAASLHFDHFITGDSQKGYTVYFRKVERP